MNQELFIKPAHTRTLFWLGQDLKITVDDFFATLYQTLHVKQWYNKDSYLVLNTENGRSTVIFHNVPNWPEKTPLECVPVHMTDIQCIFIILECEESLVQKLLHE